MLVALEATLGCRSSAWELAGSAFLNEADVSGEDRFLWQGPRQRASALTGEWPVRTSM